MGRIKNVFDALRGKEPEPVYVPVEEDDDNGKNTRRQPRKTRKEDAYEAGQRQAREIFQMVMSAQQEGERRAEERMQKWLELQSRNSMEQQMASVDRMLEFGLNIATRFQQPPGGSNEIVELAKAVLPAVIQSPAGQNFLQGLAGAPGPGAKTETVPATTQQNPNHTANGAGKAEQPASAARPRPQLHPFIEGFIRDYRQTLLNNGDVDFHASQLFQLRLAAGNNPTFVQQYDFLVRGSADQVLKELTTVSNGLVDWRIPHAINQWLKLQTRIIELEKEYQTAISQTGQPATIEESEIEDEYEDEENEIVSPVPVGVHA